MPDCRLVFRVHAIQRMFQRGLREQDVRSALEKGETIEEYTEDFPYPSRLILGWIGSQPIHLVVADNEEVAETIVITVYNPSREQWESDFKRRKK